MALAADIVETRKDSQTINKEGEAGVKARDKNEPRQLRPAISAPVKGRKLCSTNALKWNVGNGVPCANPVQRKARPHSDIRCEVEPAQAGVSRHTTGSRRSAARRRMRRLGTSTT